MLSLSIVVLPLYIYIQQKQYRLPLLLRSRATAQMPGLSLVGWSQKAHRLFYSLTANSI